MKEQKHFILGIESSCDDTAAAVLEDSRVLSNVVATQNVHREYGGVVPELASREHQKNIVPVVHQALKKAGVEQSQLSAVAFTRGPGLMGSLLVGTSFAKSLALGLDIPLIEVNHMQAHVLAHFIDNPENPGKPDFSFLALTISGGHTEIVEVRDYFEMNVIGKTLDDAIGEAFDKCGKMMKLPYPAGPEIDRLAQKGDPKRFKFTIPKVKGLDFSFSGLKTAVLYFLQAETEKNPQFIDENINDLCAGVQATLIEILRRKLKKAFEETGLKQIAVGGGVSANSGIRQMIRELAVENDAEAFIPKFEYTTDNAAMIGIVGSLKFKKQEFTDVSITAEARYKI